MVRSKGVGSKLTKRVSSLSAELQVMVTSLNVEELLPAADQFLIKYVKDKCCSFLRKKLTPANCIGIRQYAKLSRSD